jgi:hypothetical protein
VLPNAPYKVVGDADIKRSILRASQNIDVICLDIRARIAWMARCCGP